ncbi:MAG: hypothetical protein QM610_05560 [Chitinophagaceae bacterium]
MSRKIIEMGGKEKGKSKKAKRVASGKVVRIVSAAHIFLGRKSEEMLFGSGCLLMVMQAGFVGPQIKNAY